MMKVSVTFKPIHDIPMGLDSDGAMRSVAYNVGSYSRSIGQDPYEEAPAEADVVNSETPLPNPDEKNQEDLINAKDLGF